MKKFMSCFLAATLLLLQSIRVNADTFAVVSVTANTNSSGRVSNIDSDNPFIDIVFSEEVAPDSVNCTTIVLTDNETGETVNYDEYRVLENKVSIYIGELTGIVDDHDNKSYTVTVTQQVCSTADICLENEYTGEFSVHEIVNVPYRDGKVITNVSAYKPVLNAMGKRITDEGKNSVKFITLPKEQPGYLPYQLDIGNGMKGSVIDLGNYYDIAGITVQPYNDSADCVSYTGTLAFPDLSDFKEEGNLLNEKALANPSQRYVEVLTNESGEAVKSRYVTLSKHSGSFYIRCVNVLAYVDVDCAQWTAKLNGTEVSEINENGLYEIEMPIKSYIQDNTTRTVLIGAFDNDGNLIEDKHLFADVNVAGKDTENIYWECDVTDDVFTIKAVCIDNAASGRYVSLPIVISRSNEPLPETSTVGYTYDANSIIFTGNTTDYSSLDLMGIMVLKDGADFDDSITSNQIGYFDVCTVGSNSSYKFRYFTQNPGKYNIALKVQPVEGELISKPYSLTVLDSGEINEIAAAFSNVKTTDELCAALKTYVNDRQLMQLDLIPQVEVDIDEAVGQIFLLLKDTDNYENISSVYDIIKLLQMSYIVSNFKSGASAAFNAISLYGSAVDSSLISNECIDTENKVSKFLTVYNKLEPDIQSGENLIAVIKWSGMLANFIDASPQTIADTILNYKSLVDPSGELLDYIKGKTSKQTGNKMELIEIAKQFNFNSVHTYYGNDAFSKAFKGFADNIERIKTETNRVISSGSGGSGIKQIKVAAQSEQPPAVKPTESVPEKSTIQSDFDDLSGVQWAQTAIDALYSNGILNGITDKKFAPDRKVTREEFVKMCVCATKLDIGSSGTGPFIDYNGDEWFVPYIQIAVSNEIIKGIGDYKFGVGKNISREDMSVILSQAMKKAGYKFRESKELNFNDKSEISEYSYDSVSKMNALGIIGGYENNTFAPKNELTRAEAAVVIYRALGFINGEVIK